MIPAHFVRTIDDWDVNEQKKYTDEEYDFFHQCISGLSTQLGFRGDGMDEDLIPIPFSLDAHAVKWIREVVYILNPKRILEIGFNLGYSSSLWFNIAKEIEYIAAVDISDKRETLYSANFLKKLHFGKFDFHHFDSKRVLPILEGMRFDTCFIDGCHDLDYILNDIDVALKLKIPNIVFDDWNPLFSDAQEAVNLRPQLQVTHLITNIAIAKNTTV